MKVPDRINKLLPCPNGTEIWAEDSVSARLVSLYHHTRQLEEENDRREAGLIALEAHLARLSEEVEHISADLENRELIEEVKQGADEIRNIIKYGLPIVLSQRPDQESIANPVDKTIARMGEIGCARCTGIVVDRQTGHVYCGRKVPAEVIESNNQM